MPHQGAARAAVLCSFCSSLVLATSAEARITEIRIDAVEPFAENHAFGATGPYVRIKGIAKGEIDPKAPENAAIVDLDKAPRNARGMVEYETDIFVMRPADPAKGNGILYYEVLNRGNKQLGRRLHDTRGGGESGGNDPKTLADAGNGFLLERGFTVVWSGWEDLGRREGIMGARLPAVLVDGKPLVHRIRDEIQVGKRGPADVEVKRLTYPAASTDVSKARLTVRTGESDQRTELSSDTWEFADPRSVRLLPKGAKFKPFAIYDLWYEATGAKVLGVGFAATRDVVSFLRNDRADDKGTPNPLLAAGQGGEGTGVRHTMAFGGSQAGRYLRHFIELGMNKDERGRRVLDGVYSHTAGVGKVFANHTFGQSGRTAAQHEDRLYPENWFPFSTASATDPFSGKTASLLKGDASDPFIIESITSTEYWQKGASLLTTDPTGTRDLALPANSRVFLISGTQHGGGAGLRPNKGVCANLSNPHNPTPAMRALVADMEEWLTKGIAPPPSRVPSIAAGTAVEASAVKMPKLAGFTLAPAANRIGPAVDWIDPPGSAPTTTGLAGQQQGSGGKSYGTRVSAVDADGNEVAGLRLPDIVAPLATYTGWNVYDSAKGELCDRDGSYVALAKTKAEREAAGDPRPSLEERYGSRAAYVAKVKAAADALVAERLLLPADAAAYVRTAEASDRF
jgi:Alpha/beta hydrolase domain